MTDKYRHKYISYTILLTSRTVYYHLTESNTPFFISEQAVTKISSSNTSHSRISSKPIAHHQSHNKTKKTPLGPPSSHTLQSQPHQPISQQCASAAPNQNPTLFLKPSRNHVLTRPQLKAEPRNAQSIIMAATMIRLVPATL